MGKRISILGSTGSIGTQSIEVCEKHGLEIIAIAAHSSIDMLEEQARKYRPKYVGIFRDDKYEELKNRLLDTDITVLCGMEGLCRIASLEENDIVLKINYSIVLELPFLPRLCKNKTVTIRQRAYVGFKSDDTDEDIEDDAITVYVAENESVYHVDSNCSHLNISVFTREKNQAQTDGYSSCEICGSRCGDLVYVTEDGEKYHSTKSCSGLKRTIYQISIENVGNLSCCSRCGN